MLHRNTEKEWKHDHHSTPPSRSRPTLVTSGERAAIDAVWEVGTGNIQRVLVDAFKILVEERTPPGSFHDLEVYCALMQPSGNRTALKKAVADAKEEFSIQTGAWG